MIRAPLLAAALALATPAHAEKLYVERFGAPIISQAVRNHRVIAPVEYDKPYKGMLMITQAKTLAELHELCKPLDSPELMACSNRYSNGCWVRLGPVEHMNALGYSLETVKRHEVNGHCNGWPQDHPNGRTLKQAHEDDLRASR